MLCSSISSGVYIRVKAFNARLCFSPAIEVRRPYPSSWATDIAGVPERYIARGNPVPKLTPVQTFR